METGKGRHFLFLQGPHGPFFASLSTALRRTGARTSRIAFNGGDAWFWKDRSSLAAYRGDIGDWPQELAAIIDRDGVTDIVLYGDTRPVHAAAVDVANGRGLTLHVFEEGYLRPYWATYERGGSNGHSRLMDLSIAEITRRLKAGAGEIPQVPGHWGQTWHHVFYGAYYHALVLAGRRRFAGFRPHRGVSVGYEFRLYLRRLVLTPWHALDRIVATGRIRRGAFAYHVALLQLEHDASFRAHSDYGTMADFVSEVIAGFAAGAPSHHHLVFKAHPLEDGRVPLGRTIRRLAAGHAVAGRVHFVRGGKLARLLDQATSVLTINSTAGQQALWRGLPLRAFGKAVYSKPELVSRQPVEEFFANPARPDTEAYAAFRRYLLETSQVPGGFYSAAGRRQLIRQLPDMMLDPCDPYDAHADGRAAPRQQLAKVL